MLARGLLQDQITQQGESNSWLERLHARERRFENLKQVRGCVEPTSTWKSWRTNIEAPPAASHCHRKRNYERERARASQLAPKNPPRIHIGLRVWVGLGWVEEKYRFYWQKREAGQRFPYYRSRKFVKGTLIWLALKRDKSKPSSRYFFF